MTIQPPEAEAEVPVMTRREAYDTMIQKACALLDLKAAQANDEAHLASLEESLLTMSTVTSFEELESVERTMNEIDAQIKACRQRINDNKTVIRHTHLSVEGIVRDYQFDCVSYITFEHKGMGWRISIGSFIGDKYSSLLVDVIESENDSNNLPHPSDNDEEYQTFLKNGHADDKSYENYLSLRKSHEYWIKQMESSRFDNPCFWSFETKMRWETVSNNVSRYEHELGY